MSYKLELQSNNIDLQTILEKVNALPEYVDYSDDIEAVRSALVSLGIEVSEDADLNAMAELITNNLSKIVTTGNYAIYSSNSYSVYTGGGANKINFSSVTTANDAFSLNSGTVTALKSINTMEMVINYTYAAEYGNVEYKWKFLVYKNNELVNTITTGVSNSGGQSVSTSLGNISLASGDTLYIMVQANGGYGLGGSPITKNFTLNCTIK